MEHGRLSTWKLISLRSTCASRSNFVLIPEGFESLVADVQLTRIFHGSIILVACTGMVLRCGDFGVFFALAA